MSSFRVHNSPTGYENSRRFSDVPHTFKRRHVNDWKLLCPRRYVLAFMLFMLFLIQTWKTLNVDYTLAHIFLLREEEGKMKGRPSIGNWSISDLYHYKVGSLVAEVFAKMPGAILIFIFSSHKFLLISACVSSLIHMLTPVALEHHTISLLFVLIGQRMVSAPMIVAGITMWKDWAPPSERTKLMLFSLNGIFLEAAAATFYPFIFPYVTNDSSFYLSGTAELIWALFWFNITADTPQNDPLISEEELLYLENNLPSDHLHKINVKEIPWKSIILSKPVIVLCLVFFKVASSVEIILLCGTVFSVHLSANYNPLLFFLPFLCFFVVIIPSSAAVADWLIRRFNGKTLLIRKGFLCGGFFFQCLFTFGFLVKSEVIQTIFYMISYSIFAASASGFFTIALDLSPRYVSVIAGILFTIYSIGVVCIAFFMDALIDFAHLESLSWLFLWDGVLSLLSIICFGFFGESEEQVWSYTFQSNRKTNDYRSYPKPEDEDHLKLVT